MAQPAKKTPIKKGSSLAALKEEMGLTVKVNDGEIEGASNADKEMGWIVMPKAYQDALHLPGFPLGYVSTICGHSNTGKSTLINHAIVAAQRQGYLPIIFDTENNFDFKYAMDMGLEATPIYGEVNEDVVDPETGEVTIRKVNKLLAWDGDFVYYNSPILLSKYGKIDYATGKETKEGRDKPVIEDMVYAINSWLEKQAKGKLDDYKGILFVWDSVGSISGLKAYNSKVGNAQFDAGTISVAFQNIMENTIPASRKVTSKYTNTMIMVNKVWLDAMSNPMAPPSLKLKGGTAITYRSRLIILLGGQLAPSVKRLTATSKGLSYRWGLQTKVKTLKTHLPSPFDIDYEGEFICTGLGIISTDKEAQDEFKKTKVPIMMKRLSEAGADINADEIEFSEKDVAIDNSMLE